MELFLMSAIVVGIFVIIGGVRKIKTDEGKDAHEQIYKHKKK